MKQYVKSKFWTYQDYFYVVRVFSFGIVPDLSKGTRTINIRSVWFGTRDVLGNSILKLLHYVGGTVGKTRVVKHSLKFILVKFTFL